MLLVNRELGVTDNVEKEHMRDFKLDLFLKLGSHLDSHGNARRKMLSSRLRIVEHKGGRSKRPLNEAPVVIRPGFMLRRKACHLAVFSGKLPSMAAEIYCTLQSNSR